MLEMKMTTDLQTALPAVIEFNFDELKNELEERLHHYNTLVVTEDAIQDAKSDRANLRKLREAIETRRKEVKRECERPYKAFETKVKELTALIDAPIASIDRQVKSFEEQEKEKKREEIGAAYDELVPDEFRDIIPLDRILDPKWLNKSTPMKSVRDELAAAAYRTKVDVLYLESAVAPEYLTAVRAKYVETLNIDAALYYRDALIATEQTFGRQEEAMDRRTAQRTACEAQRPQADEQPPVAVQEPARDPGEEEKVYSLRLQFQLTMNQANALKRFLMENNINYTKI